MMVEKDPFLNFISDLSEKIKISKEHKQIMQRVNDPAASIDESKASLDNLILTIKQKIESTVTNKESVPALSTTQTTPLTSSIVKVVSEEENKFQDFVGKLKGILDKPREMSADATSTSSVSSVSASDVKGEEQQDVKKYVNILNQPKIQDNKKTQNYVEELEKIKDGIQVEKEDTKVTEIKKLIEEYAEKYIKKAVGMMGESGGGTVAVQYANGGIMNGNLNVNGNYLSAGVNLTDIFALQPDLDKQALTYTDANYDLSISGGNTVNLSAINTTFNANSGKYESNYTTTNVNSANWSAAYTNLTSNSAAYLSAVDLSAIAAASGSWNSTYTTVSVNSAYWADTRYDVTFEQDVTIQGNLTALGTSTFNNTIFTTTTALSVVNTGPGPALYVYQAAGPYDVASFYDGDGVEVLHVGNAQGAGNPLGQVGINTSFPSAELTVNGAMSSNGVITVLGGDSNQWNSNYSTTNANSGNWGSVYTTFNTNSAKYDSVYTTSNANSANWILDGGNTKGSNISIGTNDAYNLNFETNNVTRVTFLSSGQLGVNKLTPVKAIDISGNLQIAYAEGISPGVFVGGLYVRYPVTAPKDGRYNGFYGWSSTQNRYVSGTNLATQYYITSAAGGWQLRDTSGNRLIASNANTASTLVPPRFGWINNKAWDIFDTAPTIQNTDYGVVVKETLSCNAGYFNYIGNNDNFVIERLGLKNLTLTDNEGWRGGRTTISNTLCVAPADPTNYFDQPNIFFSDAGLFHATGPRASQEYRSLYIGSNLTTANGADLAKLNTIGAAPFVQFRSDPQAYDEDDAYGSRNGLAICNMESVPPSFNVASNFVFIDTHDEVSTSYGTIKIGSNIITGINEYVPITNARVQIEGNVNVNGLIRTTVAADSLYTGNSNNWNSNYTTTNANSGIWSNWSTVSASYALGSKYVKLSGDTMTGGLSTVALSTNDIYGASNQSVFTDGSNLAGNGTGTLTLNYVNGIFTTNTLNAALFQDTLGRSSTQWNSNYTSFNSNSAKYDSVYTTFNTNSAKYDSVYTTFNTNSAKYDSVYTTFNTNSAKYDSVYTTFNTNSAKYDSVYTTFNTNSGKYDANYTSFNTNSAKYDSNWTTTNSSSATWYAYTQNLSTFNTTLATVDPAVLWVSSLSGILPGTEITSRLSTSRGKIRGRIFMQMVNTATNKNLYLRFANNNAFASSTNIINAGNANTQSWIRTFEGILLPGNQIIFSPYQGNVEDGLRNNPFTTYNYTPGDSIYYQVGVSIGTGSEFVAISGGYVSISPD